MIWYIEQSKENVETKCRISKTDEAKGTFGETFVLKTVVRTNELEVYKK